MLLLSAARTGDITSINALVKRGARVNAQNKLGWTALNAAADYGKKGAINALISSGANVHIGDNQGWTPLHRAALKGHDKAVKSLIEAGAWPNCVEENGKSAVHLAAAGGYTDILSQLLSAGGNPDIRDKCHRSPAHLAAKFGNASSLELLYRHNSPMDILDKLGNTPLHMAAEEGNLNVVKVLIKCDVNLNIQNKLKCTPLHLAVRNGYLRIVQALIASGAKVEIKNKLKRTPLDQVASSVQCTDVMVSMARLLYIGGASWKVPVNDQDQLLWWQHLKSFTYKQMRVFLSAGGISIFKWPLIKRRVATKGMIGLPFHKHLISVMHDAEINPYNDWDFKRFYEVPWNLCLRAHALEWAWSSFKLIKHPTNFKTYNLMQCKQAASKNLSSMTSLFHKLKGADKYNIKNATWVHNHHMSKSFQRFKIGFEARISAAPEHFAKNEWKNSLKVSEKDKVMDYYKKYVNKFAWNDTTDEESLPVILMARGTTRENVPKILSTGFGSVADDENFNFTTHVEYACKNIKEGVPVIIICAVIPGNVYPVLKDSDESNTVACAVQQQEILRLGSAIPRGYQSQYTYGM